MEKFEYKIIDNFLDKEFFLRLKKQIEYEDFPWRRRIECTRDSKNDKGYFTHSIFNEFKINSPMYENTLIPILYKLKARSIINASVHMFLTEFFLKKSTVYHQDWPYNSTTAILKDKEIVVESKENRIVIFNTQIKHRTIKNTTAGARYILNMNYF